MRNRVKSKTEVVEMKRRRQKSINISERGNCILVLREREESRMTPRLLVWMTG